MNTEISYAQVIEKYFEDVKNLVTKKLHGKKGVETGRVNFILTEKRKQIYDFLIKKRKFENGCVEIEKIIESRFGNVEKIADLVIYELENDDGWALQPGEAVWLGVCSGIAKKMDANPYWIRLFFVILGIFLGMGLLCYFLVFLYMYRHSKNIQRFISVNWYRLSLQLTSVLAFTVLVLVSFHYIITGIINLYIFYVGEMPREIDWLNDTKKIAKILSFICGFSSALFSIYASLPLLNGWDETFGNLRNATIALFVFFIFVDLSYILTKMILIGISVLVF